MRGKLIFPFNAVLARLDTTATAADPDGPGGLASGFDFDFKETTLAPTGSTVGVDARKESALVTIPCQVEMDAFQQQRILADADSPNSELALVFHFSHLEREGFVDALTGAANINPSDRLVRILDKCGDVVIEPEVPPGLYATESRPIGIGLGRKRNLLLVTFAERPIGLRTP